MSTVWLSYDLSDFMLFSHRAYFRQFALMNARFWPGQFLTLAIGILLLIGLLKPTPVGNRLAMLALSAVWMFVGWFYLWDLYVNINWTAYWFVHLFMLQGITCGILALSPKGIEFFRPKIWIIWVIYFMLAFMLLVYPFMSLFYGRELIELEVFGFAPNSTAWFTILYFNFTNSRLKLPLMVIPSLWLIYSLLTLAALRSSML